MLTQPYVTVPEFRFHPTFLDSNNLVSAGSQAQQDAALFTALLTASTWADQHLFGHDGTIAAHTRVENARIKADRWGRLRYHPEHVPVQTVTSIAIGTDPSAVTAVSSPAVWTEQDGRIILAAITAAGTGLDRFQFGRPATQYEQLVTWTYVAGYAATQLASPVSSGATSVSVLDATGIVAPTSTTPGTVLRLWTPGLEEAVTVSAVSGTTVTLSAPLTYAHKAGDSIQALPPTIREAVINKAICELLRPNAVSQQAAQQGPSPTSTSKDPARVTGGGIYHERAEGLLRPFRRIR